jgi:hypothetical protein
MTLQLGELLESVYRGIHDDVVDGVATNGSATTIVDTTLSTKYTQNRFKDWIAFISRTTDGLTPQGKYAIISSYVASTKTVTMATVTDAVAAGDEYALCKGTIPLYTLIKLCNDALRKLGTILVRDVSLSVSGDALLYTLPAVTKGKQFYSLHLMNSEYEVCEAPNYEIVKAAGGATNSLLFKWQPSSSYPTIVINYAGLHPKMTAYNSYVEESIHPELAAAACIERAFYWKAMPKQRASDMKNWQLAKNLLQEAKALHPIEKPSVENQRIPVGIYN